MYESPIIQMSDEMKIHYENGVYKAVQHFGFDVNKEELLKALQYDREQYTKGYKDGYERAVEAFAEKLTDYSYGSIHTNTVEHISLPISEVNEIIKELRKVMSC